MIRISRADAKRLTAAAKPKPAKPAPRKKPAPRMARVVYEGDAVTFEMPGRPQPKQRARVGRHGGYTPAATREYEAAIALTARAAMGNRPPLACPVEVEAVFTIEGDCGEWPTKGRDADCDNIFKVCADGINGIVYADDRLIVRVSMTQVCGPQPGVRVTVRPAAP